MPQTTVIDNTNLINMCRDCGAPGFLPVLVYAFDAAAKTVTVTNTSTIPAGDAFVKVKVRVHDQFGGTKTGQITVAATPLVLDVSTLNLSKQISLTATIITDLGIIADGGAYGLMAAGNVASWDIQKNAADEI